MEGAEVGGAAGSSAGGLAIGNPCFMKPVPACSTLRAIKPRFGVVPALQRPWNNELAVANPVPKARAKPCCQDCGHLYTTGFYAAADYDTRSGGKYTCLVKTRFPSKVRQPDFPGRKKGLYNTCACVSCTMPSA